MQILPSLPRDVSALWVPPLYGLCCLGKTVTVLTVFSLAILLAVLGHHLDYQLQVIFSPQGSLCLRLSSGSRVSSLAPTWTLPAGPNTLHTVCAKESENYVMLTGDLLRQLLTLSFSSHIPKCL